MKAESIRFWALPGPASRRVNYNRSLKALIAEQRTNGGWSQLAGNKERRYATGQALYTLRRRRDWIERLPPAMERGGYPMETQLEDGTWYVRRRAFHSNQQWTVDSRTEGSLDLRHGHKLDSVGFKPSG